MPGAGAPHLASALDITHLRHVGWLVAPSHQPFWGFWVSRRHRADTNVGG